MSCSNFLKFFIKDDNLFKQYDDDTIIEQMNTYTDNSYPSLNGLEYDIEVFPNVKAF